MFKTLLQTSAYYDLLVKIAKEEPIYMFHGTKKSKLSSIMSSGLLANPKKRAWDDLTDAGFTYPSLASLSGVYMTDDLDTAINASKNGKNDKDMSNSIIFMLRIQPKSLFLDEDSVDGMIDYVSNLGIHLPREDYIKLYLYHFIPSHKNKVDEARDNYYKHVKDFLEGTKIKLHVNLIYRVLGLAMTYFYTIISRRAAHVDQFLYSEVWDEVSAGTEKSADPPPPRPSVKDAETDFKQYQDQLTRTLKLLADPKLGYTPRGVVSARLTQNVGFSGSNRIIAVLEIFKGNKNMIFRPNIIRFIYPSSIKELPEDAALALTNNIVKIHNTRLASDLDD